MGLKSFNLYQFPFLSVHSLKLECEKLATEKIEIQRHYVMVRNYHSVTLIPVKSVLSFLPLSPKVSFWSLLAWSFCLYLYPVLRIQDNHACSTAKPPRLLSINCILAAPTLHWPVTQRTFPLCSGIQCTGTHKASQGTHTHKRTTCAGLCICIFILRTYCA